ncbi:MAG: hypothetical protein MJZ22_01655 [Candidatus Saccharibacteria bacterium]|nr:hypothetical protein [Candidatus Saccharibacteria bacterium]
MKKNLILTTSLLATTLLSGNVYASNSGHAKISATKPEYLTITLSANDLHFSLDNLGLETKKVGIAASTNNESGYTIRFNSVGPFSALLHENYFVGEKIPTLENQTEAADFPSKHWGYSTDNDVFNPIPLEPLNIFKTSISGESNYDFTVGVRGAGDIVTGIYTNTLMFTVVANPDSIHLDPTCNPSATKISEAVCMQDMNDNVVASISEGAEYQLIDSRDGKPYWIGKLPDGQVWMTQNLDLNLDKNVTLTAENTDLNTVSEWTPANSTMSREEAVEKWSYDNDIPDSIDYGDIFLINGGVGAEGWCYHTNETEKCDKAITYKPSDGGMHYHYGNSYNFPAAIASNDASGLTKGEVAQNSICPKGWRLPRIVNVSFSSSERSELAKVMREYANSIYTDYNQEELKRELVAKAPFYVVNDTYWTGVVDQYDFYYSYANVEGVTGSSINTTSEVDRGNANVKIRCIAR